MTDSTSGICLACGREYKITRIRRERERKFCSRACAARNPALTAHGDVELTCTVCGKPFTVAYGKRSQRTCSVACRSAAHRVQRDPAVITCELCGEPFEVDWYKRNRARFCSRACVNRARAQESRTIACARCGTEFTVPWSLRTRRHCSHRCANSRPRDDYAKPGYAPRDCEACGESYRPGSPAARWCKACVPDKQAYQRVLKYGVTYPQWIAMLDRYDGMCWVCRTRLAVSLDHDHATGRPRGVTCQKCNVALHYAENAEWLMKAAHYLAGGDVHGFEERTAQVARSDSLEGLNGSSKDSCSRVT